MRSTSSMSARAETSHPVATLVGLGAILLLAIVAGVALGAVPISPRDVVAAVGLPGRNDIEFPWDAAAWKVCTIIFNLSTGYTSWDRAIGLIETKKINIGRIITHVEPLRSWERAFDAIESKRGLKVLLIP